MYKYLAPSWHVEGQFQNCLKVELDMFFFLFHCVREDSHKQENPENKSSKTESSKPFLYKYIAIHSFCSRKIRAFGHYMYFRALLAWKRLKTMPQIIVRISKNSFKVAIHNLKINQYTHYIYLQFRLIYVIRNSVYSYIRMIIINIVDN